MEYVTVDEAAELLALTVWGIRERIRRGDMRAVRLGKRVWAIPREEVDRWKVLGRQKPGPKRRREQLGEEAG
jgi:excisionase family DNA binding protein